MPRDFHTATAIGDLMFVFGGRSGEPFIAHVCFTICSLAKKEALQWAPTFCMNESEGKVEII